MSKMAQPTKPGNAERGWNDPPMFLHTPPSGAVVQASPKRTPLNKRVPFPGVAKPAPTSAQKPDAASAPTPPMMIPGAPPVVPAPHQPPGNHGDQPGNHGNIVLFPPASTTEVPRFTAPIIVPAMSPPETEGVTTATNPITNLQVATPQATDDLVIPDFDDDQQLFNFVITRLQRVLKDCNPVLTKNVQQEVQKKLDILSTMWESGHISYQVKSLMAKLATALHRRKCDLAHQLHLSLMMDYVSEVGPWMVGIKRLIQEARNIDAPLSPTDSTSTPLPLATSTLATNEEAVTSQDTIATNQDGAKEDYSELSSSAEGSSNKETITESSTSEESTEQSSKTDNSTSNEVD